MELICPQGHTGPWRYVEAIEVWRNIFSVEPEALVADSQWHTGGGYDDGVEGSAYLLCWTDLSAGLRAHRGELPEPINVE